MSKKFALTTDLSLKSHIKEKVNKTSLIPLFPQEWQAAASLQKEVHALPPSI